MAKNNIKHIDAFSGMPEKGNPAGVVLNGEDFSEVQMQAIAAAVVGGVSGTGIDGCAVSDG